MASPTQWAWVWVNSGSWWWIGKPGMLQFMGWQRVGHDWATELTDWLITTRDKLVMSEKAVCLVVQLHLTLCGPMDCSPPDSLAHEIFQARIQFSWVSQSCLTLSDPMNRSTPGLPIHHQLLESTQTHVHWVGDDNQPSHPLSSPSPPALNLSQLRVFSMSQLLASGGLSIGVSASASILPMNIQDWFPLEGLVGFHYIPTLTSIHDYWKNHSLD